MTPAFSVYTTAHFDRAFGRLARQHPNLVRRFAEAIAILQMDPYNRSRSYPIKKLEGVRPGEGQFRIRLGRFRFLYDIEGQTVFLKSCSLRREDTYR